MDLIRKLFAYRKTAGSDPNQIRKVWLFYASPGNWLDENGERDLFGGEALWSCEKGTGVGDLALLYRKSIDRITIGEMAKTYGMVKEAAEELKKRGLGKDIPVIWSVTSLKRWFLPKPWPWSAACTVKTIFRFDPPITLAELRNVPQLRRTWHALNRNFHAPGQSALEIPATAWEHLSRILKQRGCSEELGIEL